MFDQVEMYLNQLTRPSNARVNINPESNLQAHYLGFCAGLVASRTTQAPMVAAETFRKRNLIQFMANVCRYKFPKMYFTSMQFNKNVQTALHVDNNDLGMQMLLGCGSYRGGQLFIASHQPYKFDVNRKFCLMQGACPHMTFPFEGTRYTIIFFVNGAWKRISKNEEIQFFFQSPNSQQCFMIFKPF